MTFLMAASLLGCSPDGDGGTTDDTAEALRDAIGEDNIGGEVPIDGNAE